jgi:hypothetical protein
VCNTYCVGGYINPYVGYHDGYNNKNLYAVAASQPNVLLQGFSQCGSISTRAAPLEILT